LHYRCPPHGDGRSCMPVSVFVSACPVVPLNVVVFMRGCCIEGSDCYGNCFAGSSKTLMPCTAATPWSRSNRGSCNQEKYDDKIFARNRRSLTMFPLRQELRQLNACQVCVGKWNYNYKSGTQRERVRSSAGVVWSIRGLLGDDSTELVHRCCQSLAVLNHDVDGCDTISVCALPADGL
jgi:hypothetical protein